MQDISVGGIGGRKAVYAATDFKNIAGMLGRLEYDPEYSCHFRFIKQVGATALTEKLAAVSLGTSKSAWALELAAATDALQSFAGVRVPGAASMAQNTYGWVQVNGPASFLHSGGAASVADEGISTSGTVAGKVEGVANTGLGALGVFAIAEAVVSTLDGSVKANIVRCVFGI